MALRNSTLLGHLLGGSTLPHCRGVLRILHLLGVFLGDPTLWDVISWRTCAENLLLIVHTNRDTWDKCPLGDPFLRTFAPLY